jgi:hypothetical protein
MVEKSQLRFKEVTFDLALISMTFPRVRGELWLVVAY